MPKETAKQKDIGGGVSNGIVPSGVVDKRYEGMQIIVDTRERTPWRFPPEYPVINRKLDTGDYSIEGLETTVTLERKSLPDFVGSIIANKERFDRELTRMMEIEHRIIVVEGAFSGLLDRPWGAINVKSLIGLCASIPLKYKIPIHFASRADCAERFAIQYLQLVWRYNKAASDFLSDEGIA